MNIKKQNNEVLRTVTSDDGKNIRLYDCTYNLHIRSSHSEYEFDLNEIMDVAKSPEYIGIRPSERINKFTKEPEKIDRELRCGPTTTEQECDYLNVVIEPDQNEDKYYCIVTAFGIGNTTLEKWLKTGRVVKSDE
jgi:hypothetical protein